VPITYRGRAFYSRVKVTFRPRSGSGSSATTTARIR